jgi:hypothetical protein
MKVLDSPQPDTSEHPGAEALIEEARQRQRKRWLVIAAAFLLAGLGTWLVAHAARGRSVPKSPLSRRPGPTLADSASPCSPGQLRSQFWLTSPANGATMSGVNLENIGSSGCELPVDPTSFELVTSTGRPLPNVLVPSELRNGFTRKDFLLPAEISGGPPQWSEFIRSPHKRPLILAPEAKAVVVLFGRDAVAPPFRCISARGWMAVGIGHGRVDTFQLPPAHGAFGPGPFDPTGSVFFSCGQVFVSPFLSWREAVSAVGSAGQTLLEGRYTDLYRPAP